MYKYFNLIAHVAELKGNDWILRGSCDIIIIETFVLLQKNDCFKPVYCQVFLFPTKASQNCINRLQNSRLK